MGHTPASVHVARVKVGLLHAALLHVFDVNSEGKATRVHIAHSQFQTKEVDDLHALRSLGNPSNGTICFLLSTLQLG